MVKILFICHGNICRSTMAEFVMKKLVKDNNLEEYFLIDSRATHSDELGNDTYYLTKEVLDKNHIPYTKRKATLCNKSDYEKYDYILIMDKENERYVNKIMGEDKENKVFYLMEFGEYNRGKEVDDPWYTRDFQKTYEDVYMGCMGLLKDILEKKNI